MNFCWHPSVVNPHLQYIPSVHWKPLAHRGHYFLRELTRDIYLRMQNLFQICIALNVFFAKSANGDFKQEPWHKFPHLPS